MSGNLHPSTASGSRTQHEPTSLNGRIICACGIGLFIIILIGMWVSDQFRTWMAPRSSIPAPSSPDIFRTRRNPSLDPQQRKSRLLYEAEQRERLETYGWVDRARGKVHIPIDRAIAILIQRNRGEQ